MTDVQIGIVYVWTTNDDGDLTVGLEVNGSETSPEFVFDQKTVIDGVYDDFDEAETQAEFEETADDWLRTAARLRAMASAIENAVRVH